MTRALGQYFQLTKPRVVALLVFCAVIGMFLAVPGIPPWRALVFGTLGIWLASGSAAAFNHLIDERIDKLMVRTARRPLATGNLKPRQVLVFAIVLGIVSMLVLALLVNGLTAWLTFAGLIGYALVYTAYLKRATPQNIVIGGLAGAIPPVLGWTAVTGALHPFALQLCLIIFVWTPPHFWALSLFTTNDYEAARIPMMPNVKGELSTRRQALAYAVPMAAVGVLPWVMGFAGPVYGAVSLLLGLTFVWYAWRLLVAGSQPQMLAAARKLFRFSLIYLSGLFAVMLAETLAVKAFQAFGQSLGVM